MLMNLVLVIVWKRTLKTWYWKNLLYANSAKLKALPGKADVRETSLLCKYSKDMSLVIGAQRTLKKADVRKNLFLKIW